MPSARVTVASQFDPKGVDQAQKALKKFADESKSGMDKFTESMDKIGGKMVEVGGKLTKNVTGPLVGIGIAAVASFTKIEGAVAEIGKATGATGEDLDALADNFRNVLRTVPEDAKSVATAMGDLNTRLGVTGGELEGLTKNALDFARVNNVDVLKATTIVGQLINNLGGESEDAAILMDKLTLAAQKSGISAVDLGKNIIDAGPAFQELGFSIDDSIALFSAFETAGLAPTEVIGSLHRAITNMAKDVGKLDELEQGLIKPNEMFQELIDRIKQAPDLLTATTLAAETFGARAGGKMAAQIREGRFEIEEFSAEIANAAGVVSNTADATQTFGDRMAIARNEVILVGEQFGDILIPFIEQAIEVFKQLVGRFSELDEGTQKILVFVAAFAAVIGPLLIVVGKIAIGISAMAKAFVFLRTAMMAHPILAAATVITLIATALFAFNNSAKEAKARTDDFADSISQIGRDQTLRNSLVDMVKGNEDLAHVLGNSSLSINELETAIKNGSAGTEEFQQRIEDAAEQAGIFDSRRVRPLTDGIKNLNTTFGDAVTKNTNLSLALVGTMEHLDALHEVMVESERQAGMLNGAVGEVAEGAEEAAASFQVSYTKIADVSSETMAKVTESSSKGAEGFMKANDDMLDSADNFIEGLEQQITDLENWGDNLAKISLVASADFVAHIAELGPAGAALAADLASDFDKAALASEMWSQRTNAAADAAAIGINAARLAMQADMAFMDSMLLDLGQMGKMPIPTGLAPTYSPPPHLPQPQFTMMSGGFIPGPVNMPVPIMAHGGEYVLSADVVDAIRSGGPSRGLDASEVPAMSQPMQSGPAVVIENYTSVERSDDEMLIGMLEFAVRGGRL